jgi:hypothetical protein
MKTHKIKTQNSQTYVGGTLSMCGVPDRLSGWNKASRWEQVDCQLCLNKKRKRK